jgi:hypothetical protein
MILLYTYDESISTDSNRWFDWVLNLKHVHTWTTTLSSVHPLVFHDLPFVQETWRKALLKKWDQMMTICERLRDVVRVLRVLERQAEEALDNGDEDYQELEEEFQDEQTAFEVAITKFCEEYNEFWENIENLLVEEAKNLVEAAAEEHLAGSEGQAREVFKEIFDKFSKDHHKTMEEAEKWLNGYDVE